MYGKRSSLIFGLVDAHCIILMVLESIPSKSSSILTKKHWSDYPEFSVMSLSFQTRRALSETKMAV
jgi:hypothetical protein